MPRADDLLQLWFGELTGTHDVGSRGELWWKKSTETDALLRQRFGADHAAACAGRLDHWRAAPRSCLALVLLLDQLSRNLNRGDPAAWTQDEGAQQIVLTALSRGLDRQLRSVERVFMYMPLMHAESLELQHRSLCQFAELAAEVPTDRRAPFEKFHRYAVMHAVIVSRFGRYPHRNAILGRASTAAELAFLEQPGSSF